MIFIISYGGTDSSLCNERENSCFEEADGNLMIVYLSVEPVIYIFTFSGVLSTGITLLVGAKFKMPFLCEQRCLSFTARVISWATAEWENLRWNQQVVNLVVHSGISEW